MTAAPATDLLRLVRRVRGRLELLRLAKACARGALVGGVAGVVLVLVGRFAPALRVGPLVPWGVLVAAATLAALGAMLFGRRFRTEDAALFLDDRLGTRGGIVTLLEMPAHPFASRFAAGADARAIPRLPFPREVPLVPVALFLLFGVGLLPGPAVAGERRAEALVAVPSASVPGIEPVGADLAPIDPLLAELKQGTALSEPERESVRKAIERRVHLPEERQRARRELERAQSGDAAAAKSLAKRLGAAMSGESTGAEDPESPDARPAGANCHESQTSKPGWASSPYPEAVELVRAYHRALVTRGQ